MARVTTRLYDKVRNLMGFDLVRALFTVVYTIKAVRAIN